MPPRARKPDPALSDDDVRAAFEAMATGNYAPDAPPLSTAVAAATGLDRSDIIAAARITQVRLTDADVDMMMQLAIELAPESAASSSAGADVGTGPVEGVSLATVWALAQRAGLTPSGTRVGTQQKRARRNDGDDNGEEDEDGDADEDEDE